jgi:hypothetical protein
MDGGFRLSIQVFDQTGVRIFDSDVAEPISRAGVNFTLLASLHTDLLFPAVIEHLVLDVGLDTKSGVFDLLVDMV